MAFTRILLFCIAKAILSLNFLEHCARNATRSGVTIVVTMVAAAICALAVSTCGAKDGSASAIAAGVVAATPATVPIAAPHRICFPSDQAVNDKGKDTGYRNCQQSEKDTGKAGACNGEKSSCLLQDRNH